ncbi:ABC-three component system protein [Alcaligenes phenolicus]
MLTKKGKARAQRSNRLVAKGGAIQPSSQVLLFNPDQWEEFILAATRQRILPTGIPYVFVKRLGGAGDGGRDIEARFCRDLKRDEWDLYQAKHYKSGLTKSDAYPEMAKFFKQLALKTYPRPKTYYFCCPRAVGNELHNTMATGASAFKADFVTAWQNGTHGMKGRSAELTSEVMIAIDDFNFGQFIECQVNELLSWHKLDPAIHNETFGIVAERGDDDPVPVTPASNEDIYLEELMKVYTEHGQSPITLSSIGTSDYAEHFMAQRQIFYCAEGLQRFSRDIYPNEPEFERLLDMVYAGIRPTVVQLKLTSGMDRLDAAVDKASTLQVQESRLSPQLRGGDLPGTCHHLVNNGRLMWVKK